MKALSPEVGKMRGIVRNVFNRIDQFPVSIGSDGVVALLDLQLAWDGRARRVEDLVGEYTEEFRQVFRFLHPEVTSIPPVVLFYLFDRSEYLTEKHEEIRNGGHY